MAPDYLAFRQSYRNSLMHSPKGTTWKNHKYIRKDGKTYIYKERNMTPTAEDKVRQKGLMDYMTAIDEYVYGTDTFEVELDRNGDPFLYRIVDKPNLIERIKTHLKYGKDAIDDIIKEEIYLQPQYVKTGILYPQNTKRGSGKAR